MTENSKAPCPGVVVEDHLDRDMQEVDDDVLGAVPVVAWMSQSWDMQSSECDESSSARK